MSLYYYMWTCTITLFIAIMVNILCYILLYPNYYVFIKKLLNVNKKIDLSKFFLIILIIILILIADLFFDIYFKYENSNILIYSNSMFPYNFIKNILNYLNFFDIDLDQSFKQTTNIDLNHDLNQYFYLRELRQYYNPYDHFVLKYMDLHSRQNNNLVKSNLYKSNNNSVQNFNTNLIIYNIRQNFSLNCRNLYNFSTDCYNIQFNMKLNQFYLNKSFTFFKFYQYNDQLIEYHNQINNELINEKKSKIDNLNDNYIKNKTLYLKKLTLLENQIIYTKKKNNNLLKEIFELKKRNNNFLNEMKEYQENNNNNNNSLNKSKKFQNDFYYYLNLIKEYQENNNSLKKMNEYQEKFSKKYNESFNNQELIINNLKKQYQYEYYIKHNPGLD